MIVLCGLDLVVGCFSFVCLRCVCCFDLDGGL